MSPKLASGLYGPAVPAHHCHAKGCLVACRPEFLMCSRHWSMVPEHLQRAVYRNYREGQCDDRNPSAAWHAAADLAIEAVATNEDRWRKPRL